MIKKMLEELSEQRVVLTAQLQQQAGLGPVPAHEVNRIFAALSQVPLNRVRGLITIAAVDSQDPLKGPGIEVMLGVAGTGQMLDALNNLVIAKVEVEREARTTPQGEVCPGCGEVHEEGDFGAALLTALLGAPPRQGSH